MATRFVRGILTLINFENDDQTMEQLCQNILISIKPKLGNKLSGYTDYTEKLVNEFYGKYQIIDDHLYKIEEEELEELFSVTSRSTEKIEYLLKYNDSGYSNDEAICFALNDI